MVGTLGVGEIVDSGGPEHADKDSEEVRAGGKRTEIGLAFYSRGVVSSMAWLAPPNQNLPVMLNVLTFIPHSTDSKVMGEKEV